MNKGIELLEDAVKAIKERGETYGPMRENMENIATLWRPILGTPVTAAEVAQCMIMVKVARLLQSPNHVDSVLDIAGYAAVLRECQD